MKKTLFIIAAFVFMLVNVSEGRIRGYVDFDYFYHSLAPHGEWISLDADLVVWRPNSVHSDWRPYSVGRWAWTTDGWFWDSYEPFGWATYHYGRWIYEDYYGWVWVPDYEWAPAWVEWRYDNDYIGWSPLPPYASFNLRLGIHFSLNWRSHYHNWCFVSYRNFTHDRIYDHFVSHNHIRRFFDRTKYRTNYYERNNRIVTGGIDRKFIEKRGGYRIAERQINRVNSYEDYKRERNNDRNVIRSYEPSGRELSRYEGRSTPEIKRGEKTTSIKRDKVVRQSGNPKDRMTQLTEGSKTGNVRTPNRTKDSLDRPNTKRSEGRKEVIREKSSNDSPKVQRKTDRESTQRESRKTFSESRKQNSSSEVKRDQRSSISSKNSVRLESKGRKAPSRINSSSVKTRSNKRR